MEDTRIQQRIEELEKLLDEHEKQAALPKTCPVEIQSRAQEFLELELRKLKTMSAEELGEAEICMAQYNFYLQRFINKEITRKNWAEENIKCIIAPLLKQQIAYAYEERKLLSIRESNLASRLDKFRIQCQHNVDRLSFLGARVEALRESFKDLQITKRRPHV